MVQKVTKMNKLTNVVVWGLGNHAIKRILPSIQSSQEVSLYGVCSRNKEVVEQCASQWGCEGWTNERQMLNDPNVDVVYLATPIGVHAVQGKQVLNAGKHLWCEKPLTCRKSDTDSLTQLAKVKKLTLAEGFMFLDHPQFLTVKSFVEKRQMGAIKTLTCRFGIPFLDNPGFRFDSALCGGAFWDVASYTVSAMLSLFPDEMPQVSYAEISGREGYDVDFDGLAVLHFSEDTRVILNWYIGSSYRNELDIWAEHGSLFTDKIFSKPADYSPTITFRNINGLETNITIESSDQFVNMFARLNKMLCDKKLADNELTSILQRAKIMDDILTYTSLN
jgi:predicted dehydrogenase